MVAHRKLKLKLLAREFETTVNQEDEKYLKEFDDITNQLKANK